MTPERPDGPTVEGPRFGAWTAGAIGLLGGGLCSAAMTIAALGLAGAGAAGVGGAAGKDSRGSMAEPASPIDAATQFLILWGPVILVGSIILVALYAAAVRRSPWPVLVAVIAGAVLYWGMYLQPALGVMFGAMAAGLMAWVALIVLVPRLSADFERSSA